MNWDAIGAIGEILGAVAVVATLFYLSYQIRQSTRSARASSRQILIDTFYDHSWKMGSDAELNTIIRAGLSDFDALSDEDKFRFNNLIARFEGNLYNGILLYEDGLLDEETLHEIGDRFVESLATKGGKAWYESVGRLTPRVAQYVESRKNAHRNVFPSYGVDSSHGRA